MEVLCDSDGEVEMARGVRNDGWRLEQLHFFHGNYHPTTCSSGKK